MAELTKWIVTGTVLAMAGCSAMTGYDSTARTAPPGNDRFARAWCEAETRSGQLVTCGSSRVPSVQFGESCNCQDPERDASLLGRVVSKPRADRLSAVAPAYTE